MVATSREISLQRCLRGRGADPAPGLPARPPPQTHTPPPLGSARLRADAQAPQHKVARDERHVLRVLTVVAEHGTDQGAASAHVDGPSRRVAREDHERVQRRQPQPRRLPPGSRRSHLRPQSHHHGCPSTQHNPCTCARRMRGQKGAPLRRRPWPLKRPSRKSLQQRRGRLRKKLAP